MTYSNYNSLASEVDAKIYQELEKYMALRQIPKGNFSQYQPWGVALIITMFEYQRLGSQGFKVEQL